MYPYLGNNILDESNFIEYYSLYGTANNTSTSNRIL
jgi:hypothetical protein